MGIIKKIWFFIHHRYHACKLCNGEELELAKDFSSHTKHEGMYANSKGKIKVVCPACKNTGMIWEY